MLETEVVIAGASSGKIFDSEELVDGVGWARDDQSATLLDAVLILFDGCCKKREGLE